MNDRATGLSWTSTGTSAPTVTEIIPKTAYESEGTSEGTFGLTFRGSGFSPLPDDVLVTRGLWEYAHFYDPVGNGPGR